MGSSEGAGGSGVSDEEWARFVREAGGGAGEAPKEPSARARMVTERLRREDEERAARERGWKGRKARKARQAAEPAGWRTGPAWQEREGRGKGKRRLKATAAVVFIAALAVVAVRPELVIDRLTGKTEARKNARGAAPLPGETARPTAAPSQQYPDRPTLEEPFRGSPALQWADGAAGIELPGAKAVGGLSEEQVADAIAKTGRLLAAANLEPATLRGERPQAALDLLDPVQEDGRGLLEKALARPSKDADPLWLFSRFDPAQARVHGDVVKTRGRMWFDSTRPGEVLVHSDYTFVYPLVQARAGADEVARTIVRRELTVALADPARIEATPGKLQIVSWSESAGNDDCSRDGQGYLHPMFQADQRARPSSEASGPVTDPYDRSKDVAALPKECGRVSRS
ncbi:hypothetical protein GCM10010347_12220 [Streptomyces cirratus]|uniref:Uncharacterized protein n=1 Tax=Streptomyces cirratus TaxID=68187 RepID=A0ABQ3EKV9_9ACTN|nr:hypothetical protein [Streptomyces cirratus]GHB44369.1 hypothetical protein GCM10010347_12220 [Streptomyces cirratus]